MRARVPHLPVRAQHRGGQALQEAPALTARHRRRSPSPSPWAQTRTIQPRSSPSPCTRSSTSTTPSRSPSGQDGATREGTPGAAHRQPALGVRQATRMNIAMPDPEKAPCCPPALRDVCHRAAHRSHARGVAERQRSSSPPAAGRSARTPCGRCCATPRMPGYVSARRDTSKAIKGLHEPIVEEALFDRVQQMRAGAPAT